MPYGLQIYSVQSSFYVTTELNSVNFIKLNLKFELLTSYRHFKFSSKYPRKTANYSARVLKFNGRVGWGCLKLYEFLKFMNRIALGLLQFRNETINYIIPIQTSLI